MRTDENMARKSFRHSGQWATDPRSGNRTPQIDRRLNSTEMVDGRLVVHSLSGNERNHLFLNRGGREFTDVSTLSGIDTPADSRTFVLLDYDRDGYQDIALVNANAPLLNLYRNQIARLEALRDTGGGRMIAMRFVGANHSSQPSGDGASRDGYGAMVTVTLDGLSIKREHHCSDGYGAQNSATMIIGIGRHGVAKFVSVRWPSGRVQQIADVPAGTLLTVYEDPAHSPGESEFVAEPYLRDLALDRPASVASTKVDGPRMPDLEGITSLPARVTSKSKLKMFTTMATWCAACKSHLPQVAHLRSVLGPEEIEILGLPVDENDDLDMLRAYVDRWHPAYRLLAGLTDAQQAAIKQVLLGTAGSDVLPSTIITDDVGHVLLSIPGVPTVSQVRKLLAPPSSSVSLSSSATQHARDGKK